MVWDPANGHPVIDRFFGRMIGVIGAQVTDVHPFVGLVRILLVVDNEVLDLLDVLRQGGQNPGKMIEGDVQFI